MLKRYLIISTLLGGLFFSSSVSAQFEQRYQYKEGNSPEWIQLMYSEDASLPLVLEAYEKFYKTHEFQKNQHTQYLKRWIVQEERIGDSQSAERRIEKDNYQRKIQKKNRINSAGKEWKGIGPFDYDEDTPNMSYAAGSAHVYTVEQAENNTDVLYAGTANAGLWKSTDKGLTWELKTREMVISTVYAIEIDYTNANVVYMSGDRKLWKSTDGANSWGQIGASTLDDVSIADIEVKPTNNNTLFVCSDKGLYRSENGGTSFTELLSGDIQEIEFNPTNSDIIYVIRQSGTVTEFFKSIDGGNTFVQKTNGWPVPTSGNEQKRTEIAVTSANPNKIYALATGKANGGSGLYGIYVSTDQGESWTFECCGNQPAGVPSETNKNLMAWSDQGTDDGGQYYYDLALGVASNDENKLLVGGVNLWHSDNGGKDFYCPSKWSHSGDDQYVHADLHDIKVYGQDIWIACDGGIFYSNDNGASFQKRMKGIEGTDFWGFGIGYGQYGSQVMIGGTYHNGTHLRDNDVYREGWNCIHGGDNNGGAVNYSNDRVVYYQGGAKQLPGDRTQGLIGLMLAKNASTRGGTGESSAIRVHPHVFTTLFVGNETSLWKSIDNGVNFTLLKDFGVNVADIEICWENPDVIYVTTQAGVYDRKEVYRSIDGGTSWTTITLPSNLNANEDLAYDIVASSTNENEVWVARIPRYNWSSLNKVGYKVFKSSDKGTTWENITVTGLEDELITSITHHRGSKGGIYVGTRRAVYYKNDEMSTWELYTENLPALTYITALHSSYYNGKIVAGTNRSAYEAPFRDDVAPVADIAVEKTTTSCTGGSIRFYDHSTVSSTELQREWIFEGGIPNTTSDESPTITYPLSGTYDVTLIVTDAHGTHTKTLTDYITVTGDCNSSTDIGISSVSGIPTDITCENNSFEPSVVVANYGLNTITSYKLELFVNGELSTTKEVATNLESTQTEIIELGTIVGATSIEVVISDPNNEVDNNLINNQYSQVLLMGNEIDFSGMTTVSASTENSGGEIENSIDNDINTIWHSRWSTGKDPMPYELIYDLGTSYNVTQVSLLNRQNNSNGYLKNVEFSVSEDGTNYSTPFNVEFLSQKTWQSAGLPKQTGRYIKVNITETMSGGDVASIAEIRFGECPAVITKSTSLELAENVSVYPNPIIQGSELVIKLEKEEETNVIIYNVNGVEVKNIALSNKSTISTKDLTEGIYYYQIKTKSFMRFGTLVIQ